MREKIKGFWSRHGYACVLAVCIAMVGATAFWTRKPQPEPQAPEVTRYATATPQPTPRPVSVDVTIEPAATPGPFALPCGEETGMLYAEDTLIYHRTLGEYRTHAGVDFLGEEGDAVRAVGGGTVTRVWEDPLLGHCIEITHRDGYISRYASLNSAGLVEEQATVSGGQVIGTMGTSAVTECAEGPHLHFELRRLKQALDPMKYLRPEA